MPNKIRRTLIDRPLLDGASLSENASPSRSLAAAPPALPPGGFTRWSGLRRIIPLSREAVRLRELANRFPKRVNLGSARCVAWKNSDILEWLADPTNYRASEVAQ